VKCEFHSFNNFMEHFPIWTVVVLNSTQLAIRGQSHHHDLLLGGWSWSCSKGSENWTI
jgi:hypothetical protein